MIDQPCIDLGGKQWLFASVAPRPLWQSDDLASATDWQPATVPGNVESDLLALGHIPDPFIGLNNEEGRWVEQRDWWYRRRLLLPPGALREPGTRAHLALHGVDYYSATYANGALLGSHEGMFSPQVFEVTHLLGSAELDLAVRLWGAHALPKRRRLGLRQRLLDPLLRPLVGAPGLGPARIQTTKCQMSFGWDFAPALPTCGIWDEAQLILSGPVYIADAWLRTESRPGQAAAVLRLALDAAAAGAARLRCLVAPVAGGPAQEFATDLQLAAGAQVHTLHFVLEAPRLWQPWDRGAAHLYRLDIEVQPAAGPPSRHSLDFGVRAIQMAPTARARPGQAPWIFTINGQREFVRGLNWAPADILPGRLREDDYRRLIALAKAANANMLRVWGGGLREKRAFYDLCDREGMLVWQEFPFACPNFAPYPADAAFLSLAERETAAIVRTLRRHPSLVLWCGGNEFSPAQNRALVDRLQRAATENDGTRPFRPASPALGDRHNWRVWHRLAPLHTYLRERAPFVSEFGLQSAPAVETLQRMLPGGAWPPGKGWHYHRAELGKLWRYAEVFLVEEKTELEGFVHASQEAQARGVQIMIEHMRRRKYEAGGVMVWQLNEPWPAICWSLVDAWGRPKRAYEMVRRCFSPALVSVAYPARTYRPGERFAGTVWLLNDLAAPLAGCEVRLRLGDQEVYRRPLSVTADSAAYLGDVTVNLPFGLGWPRLEAELWQGATLLSSNEYDLSWYDGRDMPLWQRLIALAAEWAWR